MLSLRRMPTTAMLCAEGQAHDTRCPALCERRARRAPDRQKGSGSKPMKLRSIASGYRAAHKRWAGGLVVMLYARPELQALNRRPQDMLPDGGTIVCLIQDDPKSFSRRGLAQSNSWPTRSAREQPCQSQANALDRHSESTDWSPLGCVRQRISLPRKRTTDFALPIGGRQIVFQLSARASKRLSYKAVPRPLRPNDFNPGSKAWLPILHTIRGRWHFTALHSNTSRAHELGRVWDWVVICFYDDHSEAQRTIVTETRGPFLEHRIVRGREAECMTCYETAMPSDH